MAVISTSEADPDAGTFGFGSPVELAGSAVIVNSLWVNTLWFLTLLVVRDLTSKKGPIHVAGHFISVAVPSIMDERALSYGKRKRWEALIFFSHFFFAIISSAALQS